MATLNAEKRQVTLNNGVVLTLRPLMPLVLERFRTNTRGRPVPPKQTVTYADGSTSTEDNPNDPEYLKAMAEWELERGMRVTNYILVEGIVENPSEEFMEQYREYFPDATAKELKYLWIASLLPDQDELTDLITAIVGQTMPTREGLEEAANTFQGDGK